MNEAAPKSYDFMDPEPSDLHSRRLHIGNLRLRINELQYRMGYDDASFVNHRHWEYYCDSDECGDTYISDYLHVFGAFSPHHNRASEDIRDDMKEEEYLFHDLFRLLELNDESGLDPRGGPRGIWL